MSAKSKVRCQVTPMGPENQNAETGSVSTTASCGCPECKLPPPQANHSRPVRTFQLEVHEATQWLKPDKASGPDGIPRG